MACRGVLEFKLALFKPAITFEGIYAYLRAAVGTEQNKQVAEKFTAIDKNDEEYDQFWTDRIYGVWGRYKRFSCGGKIGRAHV